jgi:Holliday junction resolvasome RuvABC endonuclease subunit
MKSYWEMHQGKRIFLARYDNLTFEDYQAECAAVELEMFKQPTNSVLIVVNIQGIVISPAVLKMSMDHTKRCRPYLLKTALVGINGVVRRKIIESISAFSGNPIFAFETMDAAKEFLAK